MRQLNTKKTKFTGGFTLIELLVVISIIAMLLAILMPALGMVKEKARDVICRSNLKQWGLTWGLYTNDHDGKFPNGVDFVGAALGWKRGQWITVLEEEWAKHPKMLLCPSATKENPGYSYGDVDKTYIMGTYFGVTQDEIERCSYGMNNWTFDIPGASLQNREAEKHWRTINVKNASNVPMFADTMWRGGGPDHDDGIGGNIFNLAKQNGLWRGAGYEMGHFGIDRHNGGTNFVFMDFSARHVDVKELYDLKWHKSWNTSIRATLSDDFWPDWVK